MALRQLPSPKAQFFKSNGDPLSGGKIYTYEAGTTTAKDTYTDSTGSTANANPVVLDSRGEAAIWWDGTYKVVVKDSSDVTLYTLDNHGTGLDPVAVPQLSLVKNYSFETATADADTPDNWTITLYTNGTQVLDDTAGNQIHGAKSIKFTSAGSGGGYAESDLFEVQESVSVQIIVAMKSSVADVRNLIEIVWYDRSESLLSTSTILDDSTTNQTSWADETGAATAPSDARFAKVRLTGCHSSDSTVGSTWFDNVRIFSDVVTTTATQTLTSKTLTSPEINTPTVNGGTITGITDLAVADGGTGASTAADARTNLGLGGLAVLNSVTASQIDTGAVGQDEIAASAVGQGELKTTTGTVSNNTVPSNFTLPGGEYGFYPQLRTTDGGAAGSIMLGSGFTNTTFTTLIYLDRGGAAIVVAQQRYVQASPPYEPYRAGDQVPIFVFALIDKTTGDVVATYTAEDPPWANNGPTIINPLGIKRRLTRQRAQAAVAAGALPEDAWIAAIAWMSDAANRVQIAQAARAPIPQSEKNADMALIPHPFGSFKPAQHVVAVINPTDNKFCRSLYARHSYGGDSIADMLHAGAFVIDNTPMAGLQTPANVMAVSARCRLTR